MKLMSFSLTMLSLGILALLFAAAPPLNLGWQAFLDDPSPLLQKVRFLAGTYLAPAALSFVGITLFQFQTRLSASGAAKGIVFPLCLAASLATIVGVRYVMFQNSAPAYALGMALGYMSAARLYAVRMRRVWRGISIPWIVWRGNKKAVEEVNARMRAMAAAAGFNSKE